MELFQWPEMFEVTVVSDGSIRAKQLACEIRSRISEGRPWNGFWMIPGSVKVSGDAVTAIAKNKKGNQPEAENGHLAISVVSRKALLHQAS